MNNLYIIGDSFTGVDKEYRGVEINSWTYRIINNIKNYNVFVESFPSIDAQTIIDNWIKLLPNITNDDILIICFPTFTRIRLPIIKDKINKNLLFTGGNIDDETKKHVEYNEILDKDFIDKYKILHTAKNYEINYLEIIKTLIQLTKCKNYVFTWDYLNEKHYYIEDRNIITENLGFWDAHDIQYFRTNGAQGIAGDNHWNYEMNESFYNYIINKLELQ